MVSAATSASSSDDFYTPNTSFPYIPNVGEHGEYIVSSATFDQDRSLFGAKIVLPVDDQSASEESKMGFLWVPSHDELFELIQRVVQIEPMIPPTYAALNKQHDKGKVGVMMSILLNTIIGFAKASPNETSNIMKTIIKDCPETIDVENLNTMPNIEGVTDDLIYKENQLQEQYIVNNYEELFQTSTYQEPVRDVYERMQDAESISEKLELLATTKKDDDASSLAYSLLAKMARTREFRKIVSLHMDDKIKSKL